MAVSGANHYTYSARAAPTASVPAVPRRASTQKEHKTVEDEDVAQGRIFWLPPKEDLPERAVKRAHGKGAIEEGIYNHPIVILSRLADDSHIVHFHLITSFQGKRLDEIYGKANEFHASRRSWYLPIAPAPDHPDATSKKSKKRFPTLDLAGKAALRWDSYVNLRHVYRIDWTYLRPYANPEVLQHQIYRFEREAMIRLLAKSKVLTNYEAGPQHQRRPSRPSVPIPRPQTRSLPVEHRESPSPRSYASSITSSNHSGLSPILQSDFGSSNVDESRDIPLPPKAPPDKRGSDRFGLANILEMIVDWVLTTLMSVWRWARQRILYRRI